jgi:hypothetical protein
MKYLRRTLKYIFLIFIFNLNLFSYGDLVNLKGFLALKNKYNYIDKYLSNEIHNCNFPIAAFCFYNYDCGSYRGKIFKDNTNFPIVSFIEEIDKNKYIRNNIEETLQSLNNVYLSPLLSNNFYYNDEFGEGIYHPFLEYYYQYNDSLILRAVIFYENKNTLLKIKSNYNSIANYANILKEIKFDLHLVIYHKETLKKRIQYLLKMYSTKNKYRDYKLQIKKLHELLKHLKTN